MSAPLPSRTANAPHAPARPGALPPLPAALGAAVARVRGIVRRLPPQPPSWLAALWLDRALLPRLSASQRRSLADHVVELELLEPGLRLRLVLGERGFAAAGAGRAPVLVIRARTQALWRLARGEDDADRLFFDRALVMEGDTEFGLELKNALDAIGPLWR
ncbi:MAG: SCP2 sterol-binding domain-containing protein [Burkholderiales bacterium]|nr:SCP2 sterol-binding domain-containing protein [Burkholderiales bacterium]